MKFMGLDFSDLAVLWCALSLTPMFLLSAMGGTLLRSSWLRVHIPLLYHEGIFWGYIPMAIVNGLVIPHLNFATWGYCMFYLCVVIFSLLASYLAHRSWWPRTEEDFCPTMPDWSGSEKQQHFWYKDMTMAGWTHFVIFAVQIVLYAGFLFTAMPKKVVVVVGIISAVQFSLGVAQPYLVAELKRKRDKHPWLNAINQCLVVLGFVVIVSGIKYYFSF